jgi:hypothetical protein
MFSVQYVTTALPVFRAQKMHSSAWMQRQNATICVADPENGLAIRHLKANQREEMYFSRRICATGKPNSLSVANAASTMFGLPQR